MTESPAHPVAGDVPPLLLVHGAAEDAGMLTVRDLRTATLARR